jgi:hypothetical protein
MNKYARYIGGTVAILIVSAIANGGAYTFVTPSGAQSTSDGPVDATATFTTGTDSVTVVLTDLLANPKSIGEAISDLSFTLDTGQTAGTLSSSSANERVINSDGTYTDNGLVSTGWNLDTIGSSPTQLWLHVLDTTPKEGPAHLIVGPPDGSNLYSAANPSITNGPHEPVLATSATFTLDVPGVTSASVVNSAEFSFGTTEGDFVPGVPEPMTLSLLVTGGLFLLRRRRTASLS